MFGLVQDIYPKSNLLLDISRMIPEITHKPTDIIPTNTMTNTFTVKFNY